MSVTKRRRRGSTVETLRAQLLAEWTRRVRHLPPADRVAWLESAQGLLAHGARQRRGLVLELRALWRRLSERVCSAAWLEAAWHGGDRYRGRGMVLGRGLVRFGEGLPRRRATPAAAAGVEDLLDLLSRAEAMLYDHPPSPSAVAIRHISLMRGRELDRPGRDPGSTDRRRVRKSGTVKSLRQDRDTIRRVDLTRPNLTQVEMLEAVAEYGKDLCQRDCPDEFAREVK